MCEQPQELRRTIIKVVIVQKIEATNWFILLPSNLYVVNTSSYLLFLRCNNDLT